MKLIMNIYICIFGAIGKCSSKFQKKLKLYLAVAHFWLIAQIPFAEFIPTAMNKMFNNYKHHLNIPIISTGMAGVAGEKAPIPKKSIDAEWIWNITGFQSNLSFSKSEEIEPGVVLTRTEFCVESKDPTKPKDGGDGGSGGIGGIAGTTHLIGISQTPKFNVFNNRGISINFL